IETGLQHRPSPAPASDVSNPPTRLVRVAAVKVLLVGSGGREHALAWKLTQADELTELHAAPGNPGIAGIGSCHPVRAEDGEGLLALARALDIDLVVIGPEGPLVAGVADDLRHAGIARSEEHTSELQSPDHL